MRAKHYTLRLSSAALLIGVLSGCAARLPPLTNYSLPNTNKITFATCYYDIGYLSAKEQPKDFFPKEVQIKNAYLVKKTRSVLENHGFKISMMGCKAAFKADNKSIRVVQTFMHFPAPGHATLVNTFIVPPFWKKKVPAIVQITYGPLHQSVEKSFPEIPPVLFKKIAEGKAANKASDIPQGTGIDVMSHRAAK